MTFEHKEPNFRARLLCLIDAAGSCNALGLAAGVPGTTLQAYIRANRPVQPGIEKINRIAEQLQIDPGWLAFGRGRAPDFEKVAVAVATCLAIRRYKRQEEKVQAVA